MTTSLPMRSPTLAPPSTMRLSPELYEMAPSLRAGPLADAGTAAVLAADRLGGTRWASHARACTVPLLFDAMERLFAASDDPRPALAALLHDVATFYDAAGTSGVAGLGAPAAESIPGSNSDATDVASVTGEHYGRLFQGFSDSAFWDEATRLLRTRLERNGIDIAEVAGRTVLDAGCGGGRYTAAWRALGAEHAVGLDVSATGLADARRRVAAAALDGVTFEEGSVLEIPFADDHFDIVFSNGVLHHTVDWEAGIREMVRVLKPGGLGWLYLIEEPGGLFWDVIEILRVIMRAERRDLARAALQALGVPGNRVFYVLDHVMVPINVRLTPGQIEQALADAGGTGVRRLERGTDFDRVEQIARREPFAEINYGVGENRHVFSKA